MGGKQNPKPNPNGFGAPNPKTVGEKPSPNPNPQNPKPADIRPKPNPLPSLLFAQSCRDTEIWNCNSAKASCIMLGTVIASVCLTSR